MESKSINIYKKNVSAGFELVVTFTSRQFQVFVFVHGAITLKPIKFVSVQAFPKQMMYTWKLQPKSQNVLFCTIKIE